MGDGHTASQGGYVSNTSAEFRAASVRASGFCAPCRPPSLSHHTSRLPPRGPQHRRTGRSCGACPAIAPSAMPSHGHSGPARGSRRAGRTGSRLGARQSPFGPSVE
eukprot:8736348-Alexandrium_andersonii.AAC.1